VLLSGALAAPIFCTRQASGNAPVPVGRMISTPRASHAVRRALKPLNDFNGLAGSRRAISSRAGY